MGWLKDWLSKRAKIAKIRGRRTFRPSFETLEDRLVPTGFTGLTPTGSVLSGQPKFTWVGLGWADHYDVVINDLTTGQAPVLENPAAFGTSWTPSVSLHAGDNFEWAVRALDATGTISSAFTAPLDFTVQQLPAPALNAPSGVVTTAEPTFSWTAVANAGHYDVWVDNLTTGQSSVLRNTNIAGTSWSPTTPLAGGNTYRWWVRAIDSTGTNMGLWGGSMDFSVAALSQPVLSAPAGTTASDTPTFTWTAVGGADHYDLWVDDVTAGKTGSVRNQAILGNSWTATTAFQPGHTFRCWVRALDSTSTNAGPWSSAVNFTVTALGVPTASGPAGSIASASPTFTWSAVAGADHYELWVNDSSTGQSAVFDDRTVVGTSWVPPTPLAAGDSYRWWVRALDSTGTYPGAWSAAVNFNVIGLPTPALIGPAAPVLDAEPAFTWNAAVGADHYDIWVDDVTSGQSPVLRNQVVAGTSWSPSTPFKPGDTFRWWVRALDQNGGDASAWSSPLTFSVTALPVPTLLGPGSTVMNAEPTFTWTAAAGADHYDIWVSDLTTKQGPVQRNQAVVGTSWVPSLPLTPGDKFQCWVRALDSTGTNAGAWSNPLTFSVSVPAAPKLIGPSGAGTAATPSFTWNAVVGADHYDIWVDDVTTGQSAVLRNQTVIGPAWTAPTPLHSGDTYRWWVRAVDASGFDPGAWSAFLNFSVS